MSVHIELQDVNGAYKPAKVCQVCGKLFTSDAGSDTCPSCRPSTAQAIAEPVLQIWQGIIVALRPHEEQELRGYGRD